MSSYISLTDILGQHEIGLSLQEKDGCHIF